MNSMVGLGTDEMCCGVVELKIRIIVGASIDNNSAAGPVKQILAFRAPNTPVAMTVLGIPTPLLLDQEERRVFRHIATADIS